MALPRPNLSKIPGGGLPLAKEDNRIKDLTKLSMTELLDVKQREEMLLANKGRLKCLPDKGKRIQDFYDKVKTELERRANVDEAAAMFSTLNITSKGQKVLEDLEWHGKLNGSHDQTDPLADVIDSDDEVDLDPLRIISQHSMHERRVKILQPEPQLITPEDIREIQSFAAESPNPVVDAEIVAADVGDKLPILNPKLKEILETGTASKEDTIDSKSRSSSSPEGNEIEPHVLYLVEKTENSANPTPSNKFKPYRTTKTNVHDPEKERQRTQGKYWEITSATPAPIQHNGAKMLNLLDSVDIQVNYLQKLKDLQEQQAAERLAAKVQRLGQRKLELPNEEQLKKSMAFTKYRNASYTIEGNQSYNDHDEVYDVCDEEKSGGSITYTITEES